ncbi:MAG: hypothetical protein Q4D44_00570 [Eubacteriales bacterium]|nr:hypothetical protein [Eubacteriales bacterium]
MKKTLVIKLLALMLVCITACASSGCFVFGLADLLGKDGDNTNTTQAVIDNTQPEGNDGGSGADAATVTKNSKGEAVLTADDEGVTLLDNANYSFTVDYIDTEDDYYSLVIDTKAKNKSETEKYTFSIDDVVINGLVSYGSYYETVEAGDRTTEDISFYYANAPKGVTEEKTKATIVTFTLNVTDSDYETVDTLDVVVYPEGEKKVEMYERKSLKTDKVIYDDNDIKITYVGRENPYGSEYVYFFIENDSDRAVTINFDEVKVNGNASECYFYTSVPADTDGYNYIYISEDEMDDLGIKSGKDIKFELELDMYDGDTYETIDNKDLTFTVK